MSTPKLSKSEKIKYYMDLANNEELTDAQYMSIYDFMFDEPPFSHVYGHRTIEDIKRAVKTGKKLPPDYTDLPPNAVI